MTTRVMAAASRSSTSLGDRNAFGSAFHYRRDEHTEFNDNRPTHPTLQLGRARAGNAREHLVAGRREHVCRHRQARSRGGAQPRGERAARRPRSSMRQPVCSNIRPETPTQRIVQGAAYWQYTDERQLRAVISSRTRFPTIFERFSTRFGTALPNPELEPERAINYEIGWAAQLTDELELLDGRVLCRRRGHDSDGRRKRGSAAAHAGPQRRRRRVLRRRVRYAIAARRSSGALPRITRTSQREITDPLQPGYEVTGRARPCRVRRVHLRAVRASSRSRPAWSSPVTGGATSRAAATFAPATTRCSNFQVQYRGSELWEIAVGGTNLLDENFELAHGYPEPGPSAYLRLRLEF